MRTITGFVRVSRKKFYTLLGDISWGEVEDTDVKNVYYIPEKDLHYKLVSISGVNNELTPLDLSELDGPEDTMFYIETKPTKVMKTLEEQMIEEEYTSKMPFTGVIITGIALAWLCLVALICIVVNALAQWLLNLPLWMN